MKVIHIGEVSGSGGLQNWIRGLAEAQMRCGYAVHLMQPPWAPSDGQLFTDLPVHAWDLTRVRDFDIVHSHGCAGFKNRIIRKTMGTPIVHTYYGTVVGIQVALRWFQNLVGWNGLDVPRNIIREIVGGQIADAVIAVSPKVRVEVGRFYGIPGRKVFLIPGGYWQDPETESRESLRSTLGLPADRFLFLFVGRSDPVKNISAVLAAFHLARSKFPKVQFVLAPKQKVSPDEGIIGVELPPREMSRLYRSVDALVHPALYDAYSLAVHEALAYGLPVIVSQGTGVASYCTNELNALILPAKRGVRLVDALSRLMCSLVESDDLRSRLSTEAARRFGVMDWDWVAAETEKVYLSV